MTYKVGLTGLVGSGKTLAAGYFSELGIKIIDTDIIAHNLTQVNGNAISELRLIFGEEYILFDGSLDRSKLRKLVFQDQKAKLKLEAILHPLILKQVIDELRVSQGIYVVIVVPLLFKAQQYLELIDRSIFVDCEIPTLIERVMKRSSLTELEVRDILNSQMPRKEQLKLSDDILYNNGTHQELKLQVEQLDKKYQQLFLA